MKALLGLTILFSTFGITIIMGGFGFVGLGSTVLVGGILMFIILAILTQKGSSAFRKRMRNLREEGRSYETSSTHS